MTTISCMVATVVDQSEAARRLRALRDRAGYSRAKLGTLLGIAPSTYQGYETEYKKPYQPMPLVQALLPHLVGRGSPPITRAEVLALAGPPDLVSADLVEQHPAGVEQRVFVRKLDPSPGDPIYDCDEAALIGMWRRLSLVKRAALFAHLGAEEMPSLRDVVDIRHGMSSDTR